jgi:hypothetical protein
VDDFKMSLADNDWDPIKTYLIQQQIIELTFDLLFENKCFWSCSLNTENIRESKPLGNTRSYFHSGFLPAFSLT